MKTQTSQHVLVFKRQQGTVLLWGLVGLLVLAGLGIAAGRISNLDKRIVGNAMFDDFTYQGAESSLRRSVNLFVVTETAKQEATTNTDKQSVPIVTRLAMAGKSIQQVPYQWARVCLVRQSCQASLIALQRALRVVSYPAAYLQSMLIARCQVLLRKVSM